MIAVRTLFPIYRKSSRVTTRFAMILRFENAKQAVAIFHAIACHLSARTNSKLPIKQSALRRYPVQCASNWEQRHHLEYTKKSGRFPTRFRRDQARQQPSAGTARRGSNRLRTPPAAAAIVCGHRPSPTAQTKGASRHHDGAAPVKLGTKTPSRIHKEIGSLPDPISS